MTKDHSALAESVIIYDVCADDGHVDDLLSAFASNIEKADKHPVGSSQFRSIGAALCRGSRWITWCFVLNRINSRSQIDRAVAAFGDALRSLRGGVAKDDKVSAYAAKIDSRRISLQAASEKSEIVIPFSTTASHPAKSPR